MRKHYSRQNLILLRMRLSRCAHTSNKWGFPCINPCVAVAYQVSSVLRFCPNFLVTPVSKIIFGDHIISSFTCILVPSVAILLASISEGHSSGIENVSHGTVCIAVRQMHETRRFSLIYISAVLGMNAFISLLLLSYDLVFDDDGYNGGKAAEKRKKRKDYSDDEDRKSGSEAKRGESRRRENRGEEKDRRRERRTSFSSSDEEGREKRNIEKRERRRSPGNSDDNRREKRKKENRERHRRNSSSDEGRMEKRKRENRERRREASSNEGDGRIERKRNSQAGDYSRSHKVRL